jgi:hypothetical protein
LFTGATALAIFLLARRKLPGWLLTILSIVAWVGAYEAGVYLASLWVFTLITKVLGHHLGEVAQILAGDVVSLLPKVVLYSVPAVVAIRSIMHSGERTTWLDWTCLILSAVLFLIAEPTECIRLYSTAGPTSPTFVEILSRVTTMLAGFSCVVLYVSRRWPHERSKDTQNNLKTIGQANRETPNKLAAQ